MDQSEAPVLEVPGGQNFKSDVRLVPGLGLAPLKTIRVVREEPHRSQ